jgi:hypothetical protein
VSTTSVSDAFTVLESFTDVKHSSKELLTGFNETSEGNLTSENDAGMAILYR